ncbi:MAG: hypothetical protein IT442_05070 [Phycisphaeraceae bacterium]|nr:hypothetical protein [Phycisphaeraceae bacterium]
MRGRSHHRRASSFFTSSPAGGFLPTDVAGLSLWLRSDLGVSTVAGDVDQWSDQSGNGNHFVQTTALNRPPYNAANSAYNSQPTLDFTANNHFLSCPTHFLDSLASVGAWWIVAHRIAGGNPTTDLKNLLTMLDDSAGGGGAGGGWRSTVADGQMVWGANTQFIIKAWTNPATPQRYFNKRNGSVASATEFGVPGTSGTRTLTVYNAEAAGVPTYLGAIGGGTGARWNGSIAEVILYEQAVSAPNETAILNYLAARYAL